MIYNGTTITPDTIAAARQWFADNAAACALDASEGRTRVNDLSSYLEWCATRAAEALAGTWDHTFAFRQRCYWMQTGDNGPGLLP